MSAPDDMSNNDEQDRMTVTLLVLRIINIAMVIAVLVFVEISFVIIADNVSGEMSPIAWGVVGAAIVAILASRIVPGRLAASAPASQDMEIEKILALYTTRLIVGLGILEGAAFLTVVVFLVKAQWPPLAATAVLVVLMLAKFPTRPGMERWIKERRQLAELDEKKQE